ncbi:nitrate- and nitrite sensing domain-containing protein [Streptomyces sp. DSM 44917]|uniref:histidine kinase n=1 Tax=Streptomyces boetiae TaxID=3075541 RepID=A0ABU2L9T9_9ACTN|nr:nitrate- and nitrite sensing domain-containing protein [Streptomyces sp. DSM 44917]MDT0308246.1 nitrate- and nitrite sensing domain-containing protein [Streptomyces sp. DSM 44917]
MRRSNATPAPSGESGDSRTDGRGNFTPPSVAARGDESLTPPPAPAPPSGSRLAPRNWRVATKLNAILLIPVLVALGLSGFQVYDAYTTWQEAEDAEHTAELVRASTAYGHALIDERDVTATALLEGRREDPEVIQARDATDRARGVFYAAVERAPRTETIQRRVQQVTRVEPDLQPLRERAYTDDLPGVDTEEAYVAVQHPLMSFANELGLDTGNVTSFGRSVYSLSLAKAASSLQRAIGTHLIVAPGPGEVLTEQQVDAFESYAYLERIASAEYAAAASPEDAGQLENLTADAAEQADAETRGAPPLEEMVQAIASGASPEELAEEGVTRDNWFRVATAEFDAYRAMEASLVDAAVEEARGIASDARRDVLVNSAVVVAALVLAFIFAGLMARFMSLNMRRLRSAAFEVAEQRLPAVVDELSRTVPGNVDTRVTPIAINSQDEIGEVARAFDQVHREAVRLAAEQALLRGNVNAIFTNLSSRNQALVERQLGLISELENNEADPEQLEHLFKLDHLATRMRRNGENLLVLAGEEPQHRWNQPVALIDVMRAAASEVEAYARIDMSAFPECDIHGAVVNDLAHLLAELLENATTFSSPHTKVLVTATRLPDGRIMIEIHDKGIGMTQEDFAEINKRLAEPPSVDAAVSRRMGLYVVGKLAERHNIRVQLRPSGEQSGTTALVMLPDAITLSSSSRAPQREEQFTVSRLIPEPQEPAGFLPAPAAAQPQPPAPAPRPAGPPAPAAVPRAAQGPGARRPAQGPLGFPRGGDTGEIPAVPPADRQRPAPQRPAAARFGTEPPAAERPAPPRPERRGPLGGLPALGSRPTAPPAGRPNPPAPSPAPRPGGPARHAAPPSDRPGFGAFQPRADSPHGGPGTAPQRVGFGGPDPVAAEYRTTTSAGLPRRERSRPGPEAEAAPPAREAAPVAPAPVPPAPGMARWEGRGPRREERQDGTTSAGLPRRVPRANLTEHTLPEPATGGPQISRDPAEVRGRLTSLRRGVQQGRGASTQRGAQNDERGLGPGHTYDQER